MSKDIEWDGDTSRCVNITDPNQYEEMIDVAMNVLARNVGTFLDQILQQAPHLAEQIETFRIEFEVGHLLTRDLAVAYAGENHSNWGEAEWASHQHRERAEKLDADLKYRVKEQSPNNRRLRERVYALTGGKCVYCDVPLSVDGFHVDHVVPKARGGPDHFANYVPSCDACNSAKHAGHVLDFIKRKTGRIQ